MSAENQVSWSQLLLTSVLSVITSVAAGVLINEYLRWRREQAKKEEKPGEVKAVAEPRLREEKEYWLIETKGREDIEVVLADTHQKSLKVSMRKTGFSLSLAGQK